MSSLLLVPWTVLLTATLASPFDSTTLLSVGNEPPTRLTAPALPACISYQTQVRGSIGYDHLVVISSACKKIASCDVSTDVNPTPTHLSVAPGATETVLTFRGSPAREFTATVACTLGGK